MKNIYKELDSERKIIEDQEPIQTDDVQKQNNNQDQVSPSQQRASIPKVSFKMLATPTKRSHIPSPIKKSTDKKKIKQQKLDENEEKEREMLNEPEVILHDKENKEITQKAISLLLHKEKYLNSYFDCFAKAFQEKTVNFKIRRDAFLENKYFNQYLIKEINLIDKLKTISRRYYDTINSQYESAVKELITFNDIFIPFTKTESSEIYIKSILSKENSIYNSVINPLEDFTVYLENVGVSINNNELKKKKYIRRTITNGDSLYRIFIFLLLEYYILKGRLVDLQKLVVDIYKILHTFDKEKEKEKEKIDNTFKILYEILKAVDSDDFSYAHHILLAGFNSSDDSFNSMIISYVRNVVYIISDDFQNEIFEKYPQIKRTILHGSNNEYISDVNLSFIINKYNEACKYSLQLLPMIYNVNIELFVLDGIISNRNNTMMYTSNSSQIKEYLYKFDSLPLQMVNELIKNDIQSNRSNKESISNISISILYYLHGYYALYDYNEGIMKKIRLYKDLFCIEKLSFLIEDRQIICSQCKIKAQNLILPYYGLSFCFICTKSFIDILTSKRVSMMNKENYNSREYYCRPFQIFDDVYIDDYLITVLYKESISSILYYKAKQMCFTCDEIKESKNLVLFKNCGCQICDSCLEQKLIDYTKGNIILNKLEKNTYPKLRGSCSDLFEYEEALGYYSHVKDLKDNKEEAIQRLVKYSQSMCLYCLKQFSQDELNWAVKCRIFSIIEKKTNPTDDEVSFSSHVICDTCRVYINDNDQINSDDLIMKSKQIFCKICDTIHLVDINVWKKVMTQNSCHCFIF